MALRNQQRERGSGQGRRPGGQAPRGRRGRRTGGAGLREAPGGFGGNHWSDPLLERGRRAGSGAAESPSLGPTGRESPAAPGASLTPLPTPCLLCGLEPASPTSGRGRRAPSLQPIKGCIRHAPDKGPALLHWELLRSQEGGGPGAGGRPPPMAPEGQQGQRGPDSSRW